MVAGPISKFPSLKPLPLLSFLLLSILPIRIGLVRSGLPRVHLELVPPLVSRTSIFAGDACNAGLAYLRHALTQFSRTVSRLARYGKMSLWTRPHSKTPPQSGTTRSALAKVLRHAIRAEITGAASLSSPMLQKYRVQHHYGLGFTRPSSPAARARRTAQYRARCLVESQVIYLGRLEALP